MQDLKKNENANLSSNVKLKVSKNGPIIVSGKVPISEQIISCDVGETPKEWKEGKKYPLRETCTLCRCGQSKNKPYCDGTHVKIKFDGTETADMQTFEKQAKKIDGPSLELFDAEILCASARFCHRGGDIWDQILDTDNPETRKNVIANACDCPSGRLVVRDKEKRETIEPLLEKSLGIIEDPAVGASGPIWVRGGIPVQSADGKVYETRNRVTLCRCGKSTNKPFCDSSHYPEPLQEVKKDQ